MYCMLQQHIFLNKKCTLIVKNYVKCVKKEVKISLGMINGFMITIRNDYKL